MIPIFETLSLPESYEGKRKTSVGSSLIAREPGAKVMRRAEESTRAVNERDLICDPYATSLYYSMKYPIAKEAGQ
jgi:hypothetical protein